MDERNSEWDGWRWLVLRSYSSTGFKGLWAREAGTITILLSAMREKKKPEMESADAPGVMKAESNCEAASIHDPISVVVRRTSHKPPGDPVCAGIDNG